MLGAIVVAQEASGLGWRLGEGPDPEIAACTDAVSALCSRLP